MDMTKLNNMIAFTCKNNEMSGFSINQLNTKFIRENILSIIATEKGYCSIVYSQK